MKQELEEEVRPQKACFDQLKLVHNGIFNLLLKLFESLMAKLQLKR